MLKFGETKVSKEKIYAAKKPRKICYVNVDNIVISKLIETKTNSKYLVGYLDKLKMEIKIKNSKLTSFCIDNDKLLYNIYIYIFITTF